MAGILKIDRSSRDNIEHFIDSLEVRDVRELLDRELDHILAAGRRQAHGKPYDDHRDAFFDAVERLIADKVAEDEDQCD